MIQDTNARYPAPGESAEARSAGAGGCGEAKAPAVHGGLSAANSRRGRAVHDVLSLAATSAAITVLAAALGGGLLVLAGGDAPRRRLQLAAVGAVAIAATLLLTD